jgi:ABC-type nickel/cobalt efflux system permease component RcnA
MDLEQSGQNLVFNHNRLYCIVFLLLRLRAIRGELAMKRITLLSTALAVAVALPICAATAAESSGSPQHKAAMEKCENMAKEHKVSEAKMHSYIHSCVKKEMKKTHAQTTAPQKKPAATQ